MHGYKQLIVWKKSYQLVLLIYSVTKFFPDEEKFGMTSQIRRAAISIPANIAEGSERKSNKHFAHFIRIAQGSLAEVKCYIDLAKDLNFITVGSYDQLINQSQEVGRLLGGFLKKLVADC